MLASPMKQVATVAAFLVVGVALTLAAVYLVFSATLQVPGEADSLRRALLIAADVLLGVFVLLGSFWLATRLAVRLFDDRTPH